MDLHAPHPDPRAADTTSFPDPTYKDTVLRPLFDGAKTHHVEGFRRIDRAHLVMLAETGILKPGEAPGHRTGARCDRSEIDPAALTYTGEVEDFFFLIESELRKRLGPDVAGRLHTGRSRTTSTTPVQAALKARVDDSRGAGPPACRHPDRRARARERDADRGLSPRPARPAPRPSGISRAVTEVCCAISNASRGAADPGLEPMGRGRDHDLRLPLSTGTGWRALGFSGPRWRTPTAASRRSIT
jgi:argininosuccinate lyase